MLLQLLASEGEGANPNYGRHVVFIENEGLAWGGWSNPPPIMPSRAKSRDQKSSTVFGGRAPD